MTDAGEEADGSPQTPARRKERSKELIKGWKPESVWKMDDTGCFWKGLAGVSLSEKGKTCSGGKQSKQRNTWPFFVNAARGKQDPVIIGQALQPRCFKHVEDGNGHMDTVRSSKKAGMTNDIMDNILSSLKQRLQRRQRNTLLFLDNTPCHSSKILEHYF